MRRLLLARGERPLLVLAPVAFARRSFTDTEPLAAKEWYLEADNAWSFWPTAPTLAPVRVAVIDSGIDGSHPEFTGRIVAAKSFVGGSPYTDEQGHGTFVAGEIAANPFNQVGMAGLAFNAQLLIAKVVVGRRLGAAEGRGCGDPLGGRQRRARHQPEPRRGARPAQLQPRHLFAARAGGHRLRVRQGRGGGRRGRATGPSRRARPGRTPTIRRLCRTSSASRRSGRTARCPAYSNRDAIFVDMAAPGDNIFSTIPQSLTTAGCADGPYSDCGPTEFRDAIGTSFAAPQVSAAAALILGQDPSLRPDQVTWLLERSAADESAANGCTAVPARPRRPTPAGAGSTSRRR